MKSVYSKSFLKLTNVSMAKNPNAILSLAILFITSLSACSAVSPTTPTAPNQSQSPAPAPAITWPTEIAPASVACPEGVPSGAKCLRGKDSAGAPYLIVTPKTWTGVLIVHAHGGPFLGAPTDARADEDIKRWNIIVREGHAYAASVFRQGGFAVTTAAEDTERVRRIFLTHVATPRITLLHGQSWGAMAATRAAELFPKSWQGVLLTSGVVAGHTTYDFRIDIRALYQQLCGNHPRPSEPQYALNLGLPVGSTMTNADLASRVNDCLALNKPAAQRSAEQQQKIMTLVNVLKTPENSLLSHLSWGTFTLADVTRRHGGAPIGNSTVKYIGSSDDTALNAALDKTGLRFTANAAARTSFLADVEHAGRFAVPVLTAHGVDDSTVFVEGGDTLRVRMNAAGNGSRLVQTVVDSREHSYWGDALYPPLFSALLKWVEKGDKPSPQTIAQECSLLANSTQGANPAECRFLPNYVVRPLSTRVTLR